MVLSRTEIKKIRRAGLIAALVLAVIATLHLFKRHTRFSAFAYLLSVFFFVTSISMPAILKRISEIIGKVVTTLLLSALFYIVITPFGLIMRLFCKDLLEAAIDKKKDSYWVKKESCPEDVRRYNNQF